MLFAPSWSTAAACAQRATGKTKQGEQQGSLELGQELALGVALGVLSEVHLPLPADGLGHSGRDQLVQAAKARCRHHLRHL